MSAPNEKCPECGAYLPPSATYYGAHVCDQEDIVAALRIRLAAAERGLEAARARIRELASTIMQITPICALAAASIVAGDDLQPPLVREGTPR
jgi:hypothetical protein